MAFYENILDTVGGTPLVRLANYKSAFGLKADIFAKLEYFNFAGSVKDRVALAIIEDAEKSGRLCAGATVIEPTSGNTGIALAAVAAAKGYKVILTMPETMSAERVKLMRAYGAQVILTDGKAGMRDAIKKAEELAAEIEGAVLAGQFTNPVNPAVHAQTTGPEIWRDTGGRADIFVAGVGTGGTITGAGGYLKAKNPAIKIVAAEPEGSAILSGGAAGAHKIQGIGAGFVPQVLDAEVYDEVLTVADEAAFAAARALAKTEGILAGISSGAALCAAARLALREENAGKRIVALFPDGGAKYLSSGLFDR